MKPLALNSKGHSLLALLELLGQEKPPDDIIYTVARSNDEQLLEATNFALKGFQDAGHPLICNN